MKDHAIAQIESELEPTRAAEFERAGIDEAGGFGGVSASRAYGSPRLITPEGYASAGSSTR